MTNAEVYGALALILMELQKINTRLDALTDEGKSVMTQKEEANGTI